MMTICIPCGYIYEGSDAFEALPDNWCCPDCGAGLKCFEEIDESLPKKVEQITDPSEMNLRQNEKL